MNNRIRYTVEKVLNSSFYQMPKFLFDGEFAKLSNDARVLYMLLKDRHELSVKHEWYNDRQEVYLIMRREEMGEMLNLSPLTVRKILKELKDLGLIEEERQGLNKPNLIYLLEYQNLTVRTVKKLQSGVSVSNSPERQKLTPSNTNLINHTDLSNTESINQTRTDTIDLNALKAEIKNQISLARLQAKYPDKQKELQELYDIIIEVLVSRKKTFRIAKEDMPADTVKQVFSVLDESHIEYVLDCLCKNTTQVISTKAYLQTTLWNATKTINNHYSLSTQNLIYDKLGIE